MSLLCDRCRQSFIFTGEIAGEGGDFFFFFNRLGFLFVSLTPVITHAYYDLDVYGVDDLIPFSWEGGATQSNDLMGHRSC